MKTFNAGKYQEMDGKKYFQPSKINQALQFDDMSMLLLLSEAERELGRLDMNADLTPNLDLFLVTLDMKEAMSSANIEGTRTSYDSLVKKDDDEPSLAKTLEQSDSSKVYSIISTTSEALGDLEEGKALNAKFIKNMHHTLMIGENDPSKLPGEYRNTDSWVGGVTMRDAKFVPPHFSTVDELMQDLEDFIENDSLNIPHLIKAGMIHYQFETIHPFMDGNGRLGRFLMPLYLYYKKVLKHPVLFISEFFKENKYLYYDNLMHARLNNDLNQWLKFFLVGVIETSKKSNAIFGEVRQLEKEVEEKISGLGLRYQNAKELMNYLYSKPYVSANIVSSYLDIAMPTAYNLINALVDLGILEQEGEQGRNRWFYFGDFIKLFTAIK